MLARIALWLRRTVAHKPIRTDTVTPFRRRGTVKQDVHVAEDATLEFATEAQPAAVVAKPTMFVTPPEFRRHRVWQWIALTLAGLMAIAAVAGTIGLALRPATPVAASGSIRVDSDPQGAEVRIDGEARGTTPLVLTLPVGTYNVTVHHGSRVEQLPVEIASGADKAYHVTWADPARRATPR